jgi:hypothetical protein
MFEFTLDVGRLFELLHPTEFGEDSQISSLIGKVFG